MANTIQKFNWLHPVMWLFWMVLVQFGLYLFFFADMSAGTAFVYVLSVLLFLFPLVLGFQKKITQNNISPTNIPFSYLKGLYACLAIFRLFLFQNIGYTDLYISTPTWVYFLELAGWLVSYQWVSQNRNNFRLVVILPVLIELLFILKLGFREWLIVYGIGLLAVYHLNYNKLTYKHFLLGIAAFVLVVSPFTRIVRYANQQKSSQSGKIRLISTIATELQTYPNQIRHTVERISSKGLILQKITSDLIDGENQYSIDQGSFFENIGTAVIPRVLWKDKPNIRPGEQIFEQFISNNNPKNTSYPAGIIPEILWIAGWWGLLLLPMISTMLLLLWNYAGIYLVDKFHWLALHYFYVYWFTDNHLVFYLTSWIRGALFYCIIGFLLFGIPKIYQKWKTP